MNTPKRLLVASAMSLTVGGAIGSGAFGAEDNDVLTAEIAGLIAAHNFALPLSFLSDPFIGVPAGAVAYGVNIGLKYVKAPFAVPGQQAVLPNSHDGCSYEFRLPQAKVTYSNILGFATVSNLPRNWGVLNERNRDFPQVAHANSQVKVSVESPPYIARTGSPQQVKMPAGVHTLNWKAETLIDPVFDVVIPGLFLGYNAVKYGRIWANQGASAARLAGEAASTALEVAKFVGPLGFGQISPLGETAVTHRIARKFTVYDTLDPVIRSNPSTLKFEATDFGGTLLQRRLARMQRAITAFDKCKRAYSLGNDAPVLLPIGTTPVKWTVTDRGPNSRGSVNKSSVTQLITVADTQAPIMVSPASRVLEVKGSGIKADTLDLGVPMVVDLADPTPKVRRQGPRFYPVNRRSKVTWRTEDASGNKTQAAQWITVKKKGSNRRPKVTDASATTLTSKPVDIVLSGSDPDFLDGRFDPLSFEITKQPQHGEFVAPLFPYFIEDYRTNPHGPFGEEFRLSNNRGNWIYDNYCRSGAPHRESDIPLDFVYRPRFVQVADDGTSYMIDYYWWCNPSNSELSPRISKWDRDGNYLGQINYGGTNDSFVIDKDGFIYTLSKTSSGSSTTLYIAKIRSDFDVVPGYPVVDSWKFDYSSAPMISPEQLSYARVDSKRGLLYLNDRRRVFVFDVRKVRGNPVYLGTLNDGKGIIGGSGSCNYGSSWTGFAMEVDSKGSLYIADTCSGRIHKAAASSFDADGNFQMGRYVGWMGRCETSTNKACDTGRQASRGYSCTDESCTVPSPARTGSGQGQFSSPVYLAIDPRDVLYVADFGNSRIQRFAPDGSFAGEAASTGTGINNGDRPSFVLGNMGRPKAVTVNSSQFYVVDIDEQFVHVFKTSPFKKITSNSVTVSYVSNFDFQGTDRFNFESSDGLAPSRPGVVSVKVRRNYRRPRDLAIACLAERLGTEVPCEVEEDGSILVEFSADDPDGILGKDFLGLDGLKYSAFKPSHGSMKLRSADAATAVYLYRPLRDFNGRDRIRFEVTDGHSSVKSRAFPIAVMPVNDAPLARQLSVESPGRGFPARLVATYADVDRDAAQLPPKLAIDWGDGVIEQQGAIVERAAEEYEVTGPLLTPGAPGRGHISGFHSYATAGNKRVKVCLTDPVDGAVNCVGETVKVKEATNVTTALSVLNEKPRPGEVVTVQLEVTNQAPEAWAGLNSSDLKVELAISPSLRVSDPGSLCVSRAGGAKLRCNVGVLAAGTSRIFNVRLVAKEGMVPSPRQMLTVVLKNGGADVSTKQVTLAAISVRWPDTDGDGLPDGWEKAHGLNPLVADASGDLDRDRATNIQEFLALSDPRDPKSTPRKPYRIDGVGVFESAKAVFRLRGQPSAGNPHLSFRFGKPGQQPLVGNWDGRDGDSIGSYDPANGVFTLKNRNSNGSANFRFAFGGGRKVALAGDWDGNGKTSVGIYASRQRKFLLKNSNQAGKADYAFKFGNKSRLVPIVGDWDGDKRDTVGHFDPKTGRFLLKYSNDPGPADISYVVQSGAGKIPVVGDWNGDGIDDVGVYNRKNGLFLLRTSHSPGPANLRFVFSKAGMMPLMGGDWNRIR